MDDKTKFTVEFPIHASPKLLYQYISSPSSLSEWFADNVDLQGNFYSFFWDGAEERAKLLTKKKDELIRFSWEEDDDIDTSYFFEIKIQVDDLTKDVSLVITDFAEDDEVEESKMFWDNQISRLKTILGSA